LLVVFGVALLLFGAKRLPEIGRGLGKSIGAFKEGLAGKEDGREEKV
jgi:sec-independent protein translocase protein TatA